MGNIRSGLVMDTKSFGPMGKLFGSLTQAAKTHIKSTRNLLGTLRLLGTGLKTAGPYCIVPVKILVAAVTIDYIL